MIFQHSFWCWKYQLEAMLMKLAQLSGFCFSPEQWALVLAELRGTSDEQGCWFEYDLSAKQNLRLSLAYDADHDIVFVQVFLDDELVDKLHSLIKAQSNEVV